MLKVLTHSGYNLTLRVQLNEKTVIKPKEEFHKLSMYIEPIEKRSDGRTARFHLLEDVNVSDENLKEALDSAIVAGNKFIDYKQSVTNMPAYQQLHSLGFEPENGR